MTRLPNELIIDIIKQLATPRHELAYIYPHLVRPTLLNLALVSYAVNTWSTPFIYNRILIRNPNQLRLLLCSLRSKPADQRPSVKALFIIRPSRLDRDYDLHDLDIVHEICDLLHTVSPTLQRLTLDLPLGGFDRTKDYPVRVPIRAALQSLPHISEFVNILSELPGDWNQDTGKLDCSMWSNWPSLCRLAVNERGYPSDKEEFEKDLKAIPHLEHLVLFGDYKGGMPLDFIRHSSTLKVVSLLDSIESSQLDVVRQERTDIKFDFQRPRRIRDMQNVDEIRGIWYRVQTLLGTLWSGEDCY